MDNKKISEEEISRFENENAMIFPDVYRNFLLEHNGYSFDGGILIYELKELLETNQYMKIKECIPEYFAIGDDGGGLVFLMKQSRNSSEVFIVDMSDYNIEECYEKINEFTNWFKMGCPIKIDKIKDNTSYGELVNIILMSQPKNGLKDLVKIKKSFNLQISTSELLKKTKSLPCILVENITYAKAQKLIEKLGQPNIFSFEEYDNY